MGPGAARRLVCLEGSELGEPEGDEVGDGRGPHVASWAWEDCGFCSVLGEPMEGFETVGHGV